MSTPNPEGVGIRLQRLGKQEQTVVLARLAQARLSGAFSPTEVRQLLDELSIPAPNDVADVISKLRKRGLVTCLGRRRWRLTPFGRQLSLELFSDLDLAAASAEASAGGAAFLGHAFHPVVPPALAPPELILPLQQFLAKYPFETNVFGLTRFPSKQTNDSDPIAAALAATQAACKLHGLEFHLASDGAIHPDLWMNVAGHMWGSRYGVAFFEDVQGEGLNYNLTIEVGSMLMTGRRCALLKDETLPKLPTDLVGQIYIDIALSNPTSVTQAVHSWLTQDLGLDRCSQCPSKARKTAAA